MSEILLSGIAEHMLLKNIHIHNSVIKLVILERFELHFFCPTIMQGVDKENFPKENFPNFTKIKMQSVIHRAKRLLHRPY